jgi:hypothetical protein
MTRTIRSAALAAALLGLAAAPASAAVRYATPAPAPGADCSAATPCSLQTAVNDAAFDDEVVVAPGSYTVSAPLNGARRLLHVRGAAGAPRPTIQSDVENNPALYVRGGSVRHLSLLLTKGGARGLALEDLPAEIEGVAVSAPTAVASTGIDLFQADGSTLANVTTDAGGFLATGVKIRRTLGVDMRHVTAVSSGTNGRAVEVAAGIDRDASVTIRNSILVGAAEDLRVAETSPYQASADVDWSNVVPARATGTGAIVLGSHNQSLDPVGLLAGGHLPDGSPLIDAGLADVAGPAVDVDGDPRPIGDAPDIGADEVPFAPAATTGDPTAVTRTGATVRGALNPNGAQTTYRFEYGTTAALGSATADVEVEPGTTPVAVTTDLDGLEAGTTYHARLVAENARGASAGEIVTFTTLAPEPSPGGDATPGGTTPGGTTPPADTTGPGPRAATPVLRVAGSRVTVRRDVARIRVTCAGAAGSCDATVALGRAGRRAARVTLAAGRGGVVRMRLSRSALRTLRRSGKLRVRVTVTPVGGRPTARTITLRRG